MSFLIPDINTFFLLHTHFFSLLVYHVPILSCNPTVYTLCTVSTWGSVYVRKDQLRICDQCPCNCCSLLLSAGNLVGEFFQKLVDVKGFCNGTDLLLHLLIIFPCQHERKINIVPEAEGVQKIEILEHKA